MLTRTFHRTEYRYDARGLPSQIHLVQPQPLSIGVQTRNVAGLVTHRGTTLTGPMSSIDSTWTYDALGRVADQHVQKTIAPSTVTTVARQTLTYFGNDDVKALTHQLAGTTTRTFNYTYDRRHQLLGVTTASTPSYFAGSYVYGTTPSTNGGRLTRATHTRTISPVPANADPKLVRNVDYVYSAVEPEQVTALTNVSGGATFVSYTYDQAGNQLTRTYPSATPALTELWEYVYDGKDQLRRATKKVGGVVQGSEEYWYGEAGQRFLVVKRSASGARTGMTWFIGDTEAHYSATNTLTKVYAHLSLGTPIARLERTSDTATSLEFQFHGLASHTIAAVAETGTLNAGFRYAPFGEVLEATDGGGGGAGIGAHKRRSNDKIEDDLTRLAYYGARYYDKTLIGWTQADPLYLRVPDAAQMSTPRRANIYAFTLNNALRYMDPDGLDPKNKDHTPGVCTPPSCNPLLEGGPTSSSPVASREAQAAAEQLKQAAAAGLAAERAAEAQGPGTEMSILVLIMVAYTPAFFLMLDDSVDRCKNARTNGGDNFGLNDLGGRGRGGGGGGGGRRGGAKSVKINGQPWRAHKVGECRSGCDVVAKDIEAAIGGKTHHIEPKYGAPYLGQVRDHGGMFKNPAGDGGVSKGWPWHEVVVKDNRVYDALTGPVGEATNVYKSRFQEAANINWTF